MSARPVAARAVWNLVDQVISSLTNAMMSLLVARTVSGYDFGGFAVAFTVFTLLIGLVRSAATAPMGIRFSGASEDGFRTAGSAATGTALAVGVVGGAGSAVVGLLLPAPVGPALVALGLVLPGLLVQESWRQVFFAAGRPAAAVVNDLAWAGGQVMAIGALFLAGTPTVTTLVVAWGVSAAAAALLGVRQARVRPAPHRTVAWLRTHRDLTGYMTAEFVTVQGVYQLTLLLVAVLGSLEAIGALRGSQVLLGPTSVLGVAALSFTIPEFAKRRDRLTARQWILGAAASSAVVALLGLLWGLAFVVAPDAVGRTLLGETWPGTSQLLWIVVLGQFGSAAALGPGAMLYAMDRARVTITVHLTFGALVFAGGVAGVVLADGPGAAWGVTIAFWAVVPLWWLRFVAEVRRRSSPQQLSEPTAHDESRP